MSRLGSLLVFSLLTVAAFAADVNGKYTAALEKMQQGSRKQALIEFRELAASYPTHPLAGNFHYWSGEALLGMGKTEEAIVEYCLATACKNSNKEKHARFMLGQCYAKLGQMEKARAEWERFLRDFPNDELTNKVKQRMKTE